MIDTDTVHALTSLPATDLNFTSCLQRATQNQIRLRWKPCGIVMARIRDGLMRVSEN